MELKRLCLLVVVTLAVPALAMEFRTMSGSGNTRRNTGVPGSRLLRMAFNDYDDGRSEPRGGGIKFPLSLPNPRVISNNIFKQTASISEPSGLSNMFWAFGQLLDHDIDLSKESEEKFNIPVPPGDPTFDFAEMPFKRSGFVSGLPREQKNDITAFIDGSMVYGSDDAHAESLREASGKGCHLITSPGNLLKFENNEFVAGDERANEQIGLTAMHTVFLREHNRLADMLLDSTPSMDNKTCYHTARLLLGAQLQIIAVKEFFPRLLGGRGLGRLRRFSAGRPVGIFNEFSTACFRFGHSMVTDNLDIRENGYCLADSIPLKNAFFNPTLFKSKGLEGILRGLVSQKAEKFDTQVVSSLRDFLFVGVPGSIPGLDLVSLNIQRGRDHGIPGICDMRRRLRIRPFRRLRYSSIVSDRALAKKLAQTYGSNPCFADLWVMALAENRARRGIVGRTCNIVIKKQFRLLIERDRFSYINIRWRRYGLDRNPTIAPGLRLSDVTLGKIIALNTGLTELYGKNVFSASSAPRPTGC